MSFFHNFILSLIEGLTEFIPVSSTGHLILVGQILKLENTEFLKAFDVIIQFGAILAVVVLYRKRFLKIDFDFYKKLFIAFLPAAVIGFLAKDFINQFMESTLIVAWALIIGGVVMITIDQKMKTNQQTELDEKKSLFVGFIQCLALIPGVSRSGATIIGGQVLGLSREKAAEFSFFLAVPTMFAATLYKLWKIRHGLDSSYATDLALGVVMSFIFALGAIKFFISVVNKYGFKWFGIYRIIVGFIVIYFQGKS